MMYCKSKYLEKKTEQKMKNTPIKKTHIATSSSRLIKIIVFTIIGVIAAIALFSVLANFYGGVPFEQQAHLRMLGTAKPASRYDADVASYAVYEAAIKAAARLDESDFLVALLASNQNDANTPYDTKVISKAIMFNGMPPQKRAVVAKGKRNLRHDWWDLFAGSRWRESMQWCIKVKPDKADKGSEESFGNLLWDLSSVSGASVIGLQPREPGAQGRRLFTELPQDFALGMAAQFPEGFLLPLESHRLAVTKNVVGGAEWNISLDSETCPAKNTPVPNIEFEEALVKNGYGIEPVAFATRLKEKADEMEKARQVELCEQKRAEKIRIKELSPGDMWACDLRSNELIVVEKLKSDPRPRAKYVKAAVAASIEVKSAATRYFASQVKWPVNNLEAGLRAPETYSTNATESGVAIVSVSIEPYAKRSLVHVKYMNERNVVQSLYFHALADNSNLEAWDCVSRTMKDIADFMPTCKYLAQ
jgi:hypothetical protein